MALREVYARARAHNSIEQAAGVDLRSWLSSARRCRLEPFKTLATTIKDRFAAVVRGMWGPVSVSQASTDCALVDDSSLPRLRRVG